LDARRWAEAATLFRQGLDVAPRDATLRQNLGTALFLGGDTPGALAEFQEALRLSPGYAKAHFSVGVLMAEAGRDADAIERLSDAVRFDPQMVDARFSLAEALRRAGKADAALPHYDAIVKADPSASQARFGHAMALVRLSRYREARAALEAAVRAHPDQPGLTHALARVLAAAPDDNVRDGRRALTIVDGLQARYGPNATLVETSAMALAESRRFKEAVTRQREAMTAAAQQGREDLLPTMRENLRRYESSIPCRNPWADDDPVHRPRPGGLSN
jgi:tetratricopeptide (TPR) repeat protein